MSVITKTGDEGKTGVMGKRVDKDCPVIELLGELDELMAVIGVASCEVAGTEKIADAINQELYYISGYIAGYNKEIDLNKSIELIENDVKRMEDKMGQVTEFLKAGKQMNGWWNLARTVCRRAERRLVKYSKEDQRIDKSVLIFINRLSDYLFVLSRSM